MAMANASSSLCLYPSALASPNRYDRKGVAYLYCSAPASPHNLNYVDLEFESSKTLCGTQGYRQRGDSLPAAAFANELFFSGLAMPLKLPPRLQCNSVFNRSKSPTTLCRLPFACKSTWNDNFDPFTAALEKVREEKRGGSGQPRRSRSYSPFRMASKYSCTHTISCNHESYKGKTSMNRTNRAPALSYSGPLEFKGSAYARWVRDQKKEGLKNATVVRFGRRVRLVKNEHDGMDKPDSTKEKCGDDSGESRLQKLKGLLFKHASFGKEKNVITKLTKKSLQTQTKRSYFGRLSFKFRDNGKRMSDDETTRTVSERRLPSL